MVNNANSDEGDTREKKEKEWNQDKSKFIKHEITDGDREKLNKNRKEWICMKCFFYVHMQQMVFRQSMKYNTAQNKVCISPVLHTKDCSVCTKVHF